MVIQLEKKAETIQHKRLRNLYLQYEKLIESLRVRELPGEIAAYINQDINTINGLTGSEHELFKTVRASQKKILKLVERELKLVPKKHYQKLWMAVGMSAFGLPIGCLYGLALGNMAFFAIGLPIGMGVGTLLGTAKDKKSSRAGNQLDVEIKY